MNKTIMVKHVEIELFVNDGNDIVINNPLAQYLHQSVACPIDLIQRKSSVWDFIAKRSELTDVVKNEIERLMKPELLQLL